MEEHRLTCTLPPHDCHCLSGEHGQGIFDSQGSSLSQCHAAFLEMTQKSRPVLSDDASEAMDGRLQLGRLSYRLPRPADA